MHAVPPLALAQRSAMAADAVVSLSEIGSRQTTFSTFAQFVTGPVSAGGERRW
jgi:hypothetical protein